MTERPILFNGEMVRAILAGRKTQTRRIVKPQPVHDATYLGGWVLKTKNASTAIESINRGVYRDVCPYGAPGARLWVRETWSSVTRRHDLPARPIYDAEPVQASCEVLYRATDDDGLTEQGFRWRPSIHMPRWASRITLEVTSVRVERLQEITDNDAMAEGVVPERIAGVTVDINGEWWAGAHQDAYSVLWEQINGEGSWEANPWVWVIGFKVVTP